MLQTEELREIEIENVLPSAFQLRPVNDKTVTELAESIRSTGLLQPIVVKPADEGRFRLIFGSHRLEAVKRLCWSRIPAIVKTVSDEEGVLMNLTENMQRNVRMSPMAEARAYKHLLSRNWTIREISRKIGKSDSYVCNRLRILDRLHPEIQRMVEFPYGKRGLSISHAEHLSLIDDQQHQLHLAEQIRKHKLSVGWLERLTRKEKIRATPPGCLCIKCPNYACKLHEPR